jgi:hypothetical protein
MRSLAVLCYLDKLFSASIATPSSQDATTASNGISKHSSTAHMKLTSLHHIACFTFESNVAVA